MIIYEVNPPKIPVGINEEDKEIKQLLGKLEQRISEISPYCEGIHVTDSVLGTRRVSALIAGKIIKNKHPDLQITISMRVRDKSINEIKNTIRESINLELDGILILKGDPANENSFDSGLVPSKVASELRTEFSGKTEFFLSLPSNPNFEKIQKKILAAPTGFMTQVIHSVNQVERISNELRPRGFRIIPCVLLPSEKNAKSAQFLNLDWSEYKNDPLAFIRNVHSIAGDVLVTSPNDFVYAKETLRKI